MACGALGASGGTVERVDRGGGTARGSDGTAIGPVVRTGGGADAVRARDVGTAPTPGTGPGPAPEPGPLPGLVTGPDPSKGETAVAARRGPVAAAAGAPAGSGTPVSPRARTDGSGAVAAPAGGVVGVRVRVDAGADASGAAVGGAVGMRARTDGSGVDDVTGRAVAGLARTDGSGAGSAVGVAGGTVGVRVRVEGRFEAVGVAGGSVGVRGRGAGGGAVDPRARLAGALVAVRGGIIAIRLGPVASLRAGSATGTGTDASPPPTLGGRARTGGGDAVTAGTPLAGVGARSRDGMVTIGTCDLRARGAGAVGARGAGVGIEIAPVFACGGPALRSELTAPPRPVRA